MRRHEQAQTGENLIYYSFDLFEPFPQVPCVISTRLGGVSEGYLRSLNLSFRVGDEEQSVITNRSRFYTAVGIEAEAIVAQAQLVHGTHIAMVTSQSPCGVQHKFAETDGLVTNVPNRALFIPVADCAAVAFFDPKQRVIAMIHAGWKGVIGRIVQKMISTMNEAYGSNPSDILVSVSPSIGPCCYEVREDLVAVFTTAFPTQADSFFLWQADGTIHLDMWAAIRWQLQEGAIQDEHIEISSICTACHTDLFYSHRTEKGKTGRFAGLIVLRA